MGFAVLFPGQGSQFVGMGADLFDVRPDLLGERSDDILGWSLRDLCLNGPEESLTRTDHAQPALFAVSFALWENFAADLSSLPSGSAGHSLGEYTALAAAEALTYEAALGVVVKRGEAMAAAADRELSGMVALIGADEEKAAEIASARRAEGGRLEVANINAPGQVVVAGARSDIDWVTANSRHLGVRRAIPLKVAGAFHTSFMASASDKVASALADVEIVEPVFPVWSNTTSEVHDLGQIAETLVRQIVSTVRFSDSLLDMAGAGIDTFVHIGPGDVTAGMAKRTVDDARVITVSNMNDIPGAVEALSTLA